MKSIMIFLAAILFASITEASELTIKGKVSGLTTDSLYLSRMDFPSAKFIAAVRIKNSTFTLKVNESHINGFTLSFKGVKVKPIVIFPNGSNVSVEIQFKEAKGSTKCSFVNVVGGGEAQAAFENYTNESDRHFAEMQPISSAYQKARKENNSKQKDSLSRILSEKYAASKERMRSYTFQNMNNAFGLYLMGEGIKEYVFTYEDVKKAIEWASPNVQTTSIYASLSTHKKRMERISVGSMAPNFNIPDTTGKRFTLSQFKGKVVVLDFWASWCGPCRAEMPGMIKVNEEFSGKDFVLISISVDGSRENWIDAMKKEKMTWLNLSDLNPKNSEVAFDYMVNAIPSIFVIDQEGKIAAKGLFREKLSAKINELLKK